MQELTRAKKIRSIVAASSGNLVEWFDFYIYAFTATYFAHTFSTSDNPIVQQINAFGVFAAGFFMRPIGSWLFGSLADKVGRKKSMVVSVVLMALGSFMIAALPSKDVVGDFAIILLLLARLIQGLSVGGEYGIAATYLSELATEGKRGFYSSFQYVTLIGGQLLAVASISIMLFFFSIDEMKDYAWRILFVVGGILALGSLLVRKVMNESATQIHKHEDRGTLKALFTSSWKQFLMVLGITAGGSLAFYTITTYTKTFMENSGMDKTLVNNLFLGALFILMIIQPLFGYIGDKIGHKRSLIIFCILAFVGIYPIFNLISSNAQSNTSLVFILVVLLFIILSFYTSVAGIFKAKLFPEHVRALGTGLGYAISNAIFGGSAPSWVALQFKNAGMENGFFVYIAVLTLLMFIATLCLPKKSELN
ncbi:MFS transporter [Campylobacter coli]|nr:MFS transporter [Campylobacter coli]EAK6912762.1 MFS transporter [Campylobacter coli]EAL6981483.1 MFS transporter [Campylobacter coli]ECC0118532.1 MFS transporter [Campylobacter coli]ECK9787228.1 MFS transporter [Campylobacter coli]